MNVKPFKLESKNSPSSLYIEYRVEKVIKRAALNGEAWVWLMGDPDVKIYHSVIDVSAFKDGEHIPPGLEWLGSLATNYDNLSKELEIPEGTHWFYKIKHVFKQNFPAPMPDAQQLRQAPQAKPKQMTGASLITDDGTLMSLQGVTPKPTETLFETAKTALDNLLSTTEGQVMFGKYLLSRKDYPYAKAVPTLFDSEMGNAEFPSAIEKPPLNYGKLNEEAEKQYAMPPPIVIQGEVISIDPNNLEQYFEDKPRPEIFEQIQRDVKNIKDNWIKQPWFEKPFAAFSYLQVVGLGDTAAEAVDDTYHDYPEMINTTFLIVAKIGGMSMQWFLHRPLPDTVAKTDTTPNPSKEQLTVDWEAFNKL